MINAYCISHVGLRGMSNEVYGRASTTEEEIVHVRVDIQG